jgi:hypothetical protein
MSDNIFNTSYDNSNESTGDTIDSSSHNEYENNVLDIIEESILINNAEEGIQPPVVINNNYIYTQIPNNSENSSTSLNNNIENNIVNNITNLTPSLVIPHNITSTSLLNITLPPLPNNSWTTNSIFNTNTSFQNSNIDEEDDFDDIPELIEDTQGLISSQQLLNISDDLLNFGTYIPTSSQNNLIQELPPIIENNLDENNPFTNSLIKPLEYDSEEEDLNKKNIILIYSWLFEINYDYYTIKYLSIYSDKKNQFCKEKINKIRSLRSNRNQRVETGEVLKLHNTLNLKKNDYVWLYLIIYYDNIKCNIEFYGIFDEEPDVDIIKKQIIEEKKYGSVCNIVNLTTTAINSNGFNLLPFKLKID